jgi:DNA-binding transcriptional regulator LsrR (DeoR family)
MNGHATQEELARAFGVSAISIKMAVKCFREEEPGGFYRKRKTRGAAVLTDKVLEQSQQLLNEGLESSEIADQLSIKRDTFAKAIHAGRLHKPIKKNTISS